MILWLLTLCILDFDVSYFNHLCKGDIIIDWLVGRTFLCIGQLTDDGTSVPKHVGVF
jgi:hypothetical protein